MGRMMSYDAGDAETLARLFAALDSLETTGDLIGQIRQGESIRSPRPELRGVAERLGEAGALLRSLIAAERGR